MGGQSHTAGPWFAIQHSVGWTIQDRPYGGGALIAQNYAADETVNANARLLAAAPELLGAATLAIPSGVCLTNANIPDSQVVCIDATMGDLRKIAAAIAKATGESAA